MFFYFLFQKHPTSSAVYGKCEVDIKTSPGQTDPTDKEETKVLILHPHYKPSTTNNQPLSNGKNHQYAVPTSPTEPEYRELEPEMENSGGPYYSQAKQLNVQQQPPPTRVTSVKTNNNAFNNNSNPLNHNVSRKPTLVMKNEKCDMVQLPPEDSGEYSVPDDPRYHKLNHTNNQIRFTGNSIKQQEPRQVQPPDPVTPDYNTRRDTNPPPPTTKSQYQNIDRTTNRSVKGSNALPSIKNDYLDGAEEEDYDTEYAAPTTQLLQTDLDLNLDLSNKGVGGKDINRNTKNYQHYSSPDQHDGEDENEEDEESNYYSTPAQNESENEALVPARPPSGMYAKVKK